MFSYLSYDFTYLSINALLRSSLKSCGEKLLKSLYFKNFGSLF